MPKIYAIVTGSITAILGVLVTQGVLSGELAGAIGTIVASVGSALVTQMAHNAAPPVAK